MHLNVAVVPPDAHLDGYRRLVRSLDHVALHNGLCVFLDMLVLLLDAVAFPRADQVGLVHPQASIFDDAVFRAYLAQARRVVLLAGGILEPRRERVAAGTS